MLRQIDTNEFADRSIIRWVVTNIKELILRKVNYNKFAIAGDIKIALE